MAHRSSITCRSRLGTGSNPPPESRSPGPQGNSKVQRQILLPSPVVCPPHFSAEWFAPAELDLETPLSDTNQRIPRQYGMPFVAASSAAAGVGGWG